MAIMNCSRLSVRLPSIAGSLAALTTLTVVSMTALAQISAPTGSTDEDDMLARARAERSADGRAWGDIVRDRAIEAEAARRVEEAERDAELDDITSRLGQLGSRAPHPGHLPPPAEIANPSPAAQHKQSAPLADHQMPAVPVAAIVPTRATIVLVMTPGDRGIRRMNPTADPIVCLAGACWISRGSGADAQPMRPGKAFGPINTLGNRAGACNDSTRCVFRNVEIGAPEAFVQPVDLRLLRHDRREATRAAIDFECRIVGRSLDCGAPVRAADYVMWVVPEAIVTAAGPERLERFVQESAQRTPPRLAGGLGHR